MLIIESSVQLFPCCALDIGSRFVLDWLNPNLRPSTSPIHIFSSLDADSDNIEVSDRHNLCSVKAMAGIDEKLHMTADQPVPAEVATEHYDQDNIDMARMGKKQEFQRNFNWISSVGFTSCTMGTW
jgi:hypothetical protein